MTMTREQRKAAFIHIATTMVGLGSHEIKAFQVANIHDINAFLNMSDAQMTSIMITTTNTSPHVTTQISYSTMQKVLTFMYYLHYLDEKGDTPDDDDWVTMTFDGFDTFLRGPEIKHYIGKTLNNITTVTPTTSAARTQSPSTKLSPVQEFDKGVKRDSSAYPVLKDERFWDDFLRSTKAVARTQRVHDVLDPLYIPPTAEDRALFERHQAYMYSVAQITLQTDKGQELVRDYEDTFDAQQVYAKLCAYHANSTKATNQASELLTHITSNRLGLDTWPNTTEAYMVHWQESVRKYHKLIPTTQRIAEQQQLTMLQNAVHSVTELRAVKERAESERVLHGTVMTYAQYCALLQSACQQYDSTNRQVTRRPNNRRVYNHYINPSYDDSESYDYDNNQGFDLDTPVSTISAFAAQMQRLPGSRMPFNKWSKMETKHQEIWDQLPDEVKALILQPSTPNSDPGRPPRNAFPNRNSGRGNPGRGNGRGSSRQPIQRLTMNLHEISAHDYLANIHDLDPTNYEEDTDIHDEQAQEQHADDLDHHVDAILAHLTQREMTPPSDIRRVLSNTMARPKSSIASTPATNTTTPRKANNHQVTYQVKTHNVIYSISKHESSKPQNYGGLVDRGANGIVAGSDVRIIARSHRHVNVQGIDNHQVPDIPIGTVGARLLTQHGPVIGIMHQAAIHGKGRTIVSCGQLEYHGVTIDDKSKHVGGTQCMRTLEGYVMPLNIFSGLPYLRMRPYTDHEWDTLPHIILTSDHEWDPSVLDYVMDDDDNWFDALEDALIMPGDDNFNEYGDFRHRHIAASTFTSNNTTPAPRVTTVHPSDDDDDSSVSDNASHGNDLTDEDDIPFLDAVDYAVHYHHLQRPAPHCLQYDDNVTVNGETLIWHSKVQAVATTSTTPPCYGESTAFENGESTSDARDPTLLQYSAWNATSNLEPTVDSVTPIPTDQDTPTGNIPSTTNPAPRTVTTRVPNYAMMRHLFGWLPISIIRETFARTTQMARMPMSEILQNFFRCPYPMMNVPRRNEPVATDSIYSDTPAIDDGSTSAQVYFGTKTTVTDAYGMKTDKQFVNTLEDNIRDRGAMDSLLSDSAQTEISRKVKAILRNLFIRAWQSEPYKQQQNPAERRFQTLKRLTNTILDRSGAPPFTWLLCLMYVCFLLNHTYNATVDGIPLTLATGQQADISPLLNFSFWQKVYYRREEDGNGTFPSDSPELEGHWVGIYENVGHRMTYKILTAKLHVIPRSSIRAADNNHALNLRAAPLRGEDIKSIVKSIHDNLPKSPNTQDEQQDDDEDEHFVDAVQPGPDAAPMEGQPNLGMPTFDPSDLVGRTFLKDSGNDDGQRFRVRIVEALKQHQNGLAQDPKHIQFRVSVNEDQYEELLSFQEIVDHIEKGDKQDSTVAWNFKRITAHEGPLVSSHPHYNGSMWNVMIEWENGEITSEPLSVISADDPVTCAIYARDNNLLELPGWKRFARLAKRNKKMLRMVNQAKLRSYRRTPKYMYGFQVPNDYKEAIRFDERNGNTRWQDATKVELEQIDEYSTFTDMGHQDKTKAPDGYKKIRVHLIFAVKHDGRHKARLVADGHLTDVPVESVYSGVVSLRGIRLIIFLAELNGMETWAADVGNAYLEAKTSERVYVIAGPEFGDREGHVLIIFKALYGLRSSGKMWSQRFSDCLREMGFVPSKAEPQLWMRKSGDKWEYIGTYVDDVCSALRDPQATMDVLTEKYKFKLKGVGPISFHLGCDFWREDDGVLCFAPKKYLEKMMDGYERMFGKSPSSNLYTSPLEKGDHPELDTTEFLDDDGQQQYQSLIGSMQWAISLGRFDISVAVMTLSSFRAVPRQGHLDRAKRVYSYLAKMRHSTIRVRTDEPDYSGLPEQNNDWTYTAYGNVQEQIPHDLPEALGNYVTLTHYFDANLYHDLLTGRSVTGILHFLNQTPIDWYAKKQATVETATYGSEFVAARTCIEQVMDLRTTLRYLGVPIRQKSYVFGDNKAMIDSAATPHAKLHKRHTALSWHRVREAIAAGVAVIYHVRSECNPADILSKHWGYSQVWDLLKPILFWKGDTMDIIEENTTTGSE